MAQLLEQLLSIPEVRGLTPVIGKIYIEHLFVYLFLSTVLKKTKKIKRVRDGPLFLKKDCESVPG